MATRRQANTGIVTAAVLAGTSGLAAQGENDYETAATASRRRQTADPDAEIEALDPRIRRSGVVATGSLRPSLGGVWHQPPVWRPHGPLSAPRHGDRRLCSDGRRPLELRSQHRSCSGMRTRTFAP